MMLIVQATVDSVTVVNNITIGVIYDCKMFIVEATDAILKI